MEKLESRKESTLKDFLEVIFRRKWIIIGIVVVSTSFVIFLNIKEPAAYESSAKMLVKRGEATSVFSSNVRTLSWEEEIASQIEMVKSQMVIDRARELLPRYYPGKPEYEIDINPGGINSGVISTSNVLWVTYSSGDPLLCEAAVNSVTNAYKEYYQEVRTPPEMEDFFLSEMQSMKDELEYWRDRKREVQDEWRIVDIKTQRLNTLNRLDRYEVLLGEIVQDRRELEEVIDRLEKFSELDLNEQSSISSALYTEGRRETVLDQLHEDLLRLRMEEVSLSVNYTESNRERVKIRSQIENLETMINDEIRSLKILARSRLGIIKSKEETIKGLLADISTEAEAYPMKESEIDRINSAIIRLENDYEQLVDQYMNSKVTQASNPEWTITILGPAEKAYQKKTRDYVRIALGPFFSLIVALGLAFFVDNLDHSIKNVSEAEDVLGQNVLASFPDL